MVSGSGTQNDPYILSSFTDLELIGTSPYTVDKWFKLGADIDASPTQDPSYNSGAGWLPRGAFTGGFDGDGKTITGLYINRPSTDNIGLFGVIGSGSSIKNVELTLKNGTGGITGQDNVGGVVGYSAQQIPYINNCKVEIPVSGRSNIGGIIGGTAYSTADPTLTNCNVTSTITGSGDNVGGIIGFLNNVGLNGDISGNVFTGNGSGVNNVGGIIGWNHRQKLPNCNVEAEITGTGDYVGGIIGKNNGEVLNVNGCTVTSTITGRDWVGGIIGGNSSTTARNVVENCVVNSSMSGRSNIGGIMGNNGSSDATSIIKNHRVMGGITGTGNNIGGVVGTHRSGLIEDIRIYGHQLTISTQNTSDYVGGVAGLITEHGGITNCRVNLNLSGDVCVGGIIGGTNAGTGFCGVYKSSYIGNLSGNDSVAGIMGNGLLRHANSVISECWSMGGVTCNTQYAGGVIGYSRMNVTNSYSFMTIQGNKYVGGLVGQMYDHAISNCYSKGLITGNSNVGGLVGAKVSGTGADSFWDTQTSGQANSNLGTGKTTAEMKLEETYTNWDFNTPVWAIDTAWNDGYPFLAGYGIPMYLSGTIEANSTVQGDLTVTSPYTRLSGEVTGESSLSGDLRVWKKVEMPGGEVAGESSLEGNLRLLTLEPLAGEMEGSSELEGDLSFRKSAAKLSDELTLAVLGPDETLIRFLNPEVLEVEETHTLGGLRTITITHSLLDDLGMELGEYADLLIHGNKVWRQFTGDGDSCLYVINDDREVDTEENEIKVSADEVAAELSDLPPVRFNMTNPVQVTGEWLATYVGDLFTPGEISPGQSFSYSGTIGVMGLLREIEEQTGYEFSFRYEFNTTLGLIERFLDFVELRGRVHSTPIEIGYNTAKIELEESEADVAIAAAPLGSPRDSKDEANTTFHQARKAFEDLVVSKTVQIPLWVTKDESGEPLNGPLAYPPYSKAAGQTYVAAPPGDSGATYKEVTRMAGESGQVPRTVLFESSEENPINLYWLCVDKIREKLQPQVKLETEMINMGRMAANDPTVYNVGDRVALQLPGRSDRVVARIQKTVKNPRQFDRDKVELGNYGIDFFTDYLDIGGSGKQPFEEL